MAGSLRVDFELNTSGVAEQGRKAGLDFGRSFRDAFAGETANIGSVIEKLNNTGPSAVQKMVAVMRGISPDFFNPEHFGKSLQQKINQNLGVGPRQSQSSVDKSFWSRAFPAIKPDKTIHGFINQSLGIGAGQSTVDKSFWTTMFPAAITKGLRDVAGKDLAKVSALSDITSFDKKPTNWKQALLGGVMGLRHPFIGARMMNESGMFGSGGGNGGKGGMLGGLFGGGNAGFEKAFIALESVKIAAEGVKIAFDVLKKSFEEGFKLFTESSRLGIKSGELFNREFAAKAIGVSVADIEKYMLRQNWGKARTSLQNFGAGSSMRNMQSMFLDMTTSGERLVETVNRVSGEFYVLGFKTIKLEREWDALVMLFGEQLTGIIGNVIDDIQNLFQGMNDSGVTGMLGAQLSANLLPLLKITEALGEGFGTLVIGVWQLYNVLELFVAGVINLLAKIPGFGGMKVDTSHIFDSSSAAWSQMQKSIKRTFTTYGGVGDGASQNGAPSMGGFKMPQMGSWEKMGYVIGAHKQHPVEKQLILSNQWLSKIHQALKPKKGDTLVNPPGSQGMRVNPA